MTPQDKIDAIVRVTADSLSKARNLSKIALDGRPELQAAAAEIMKTVKATRRDIDALNEAAQRDGKLDKPTLDRSLDRILRAARQINREVTALLEKARSR
jgi:uncharacterized protein YicC (UPF0701 family)